MRNDSDTTKPTVATNQPIPIPRVSMPAPIDMDAIDARSRKLNEEFEQSEAAQEELSAAHALWQAQEDEAKAEERKHIRQTAQATLDSAQAACEAGESANKALRWAIFSGIMGAIAVGIPLLQAMFAK